MSGDSPRKSSEESLAAQPGSPGIDRTSGRQHLVRSLNVLHDVHLCTLGPFRPYSRIVARRASTSSMMDSGTDSRPFALPGSEIEGAGLVATDHAGCSCARLLKRNGEAAPARETPARGDGQDDGRPGDLVESGRGNDQYRPCALLFMAGGRIEGDEPDVAAPHYKSSLPTGLASIQARSPSDGVSVSSHCARSSSSV